VSLVLVTGSSDGIGAEIARVIAAQGHQVILHARNEQRAEGLADVAVGDLASLASTRELAADVLRIGKPDVVVHNAGWGSKDAERPVTEDGLEQTFQVNALAPFLLTALLPLPQRLVFVSSDSITRGVIRIDDLQHEQEWTADAAYADSKLVMTSLAFGMARRWPGLLSNAVHPGWVRTKMSGDVAPLSVAQGADTPAWLATSTDPAATVTGEFFQERKAIRVNEQAYDLDLQVRLLQRCAELCGAELPAAG